MIKLHTQQEGDRGEFLSLEDLFKNLLTCQMQDNMAIVKIDGDDGDYFKMFVIVNGLKQRAGNGAVLSGGAVAAWTILGSFPDGSGWRFVMGTAVFAAQQQPGPRLARG
jgi:hypothetical protein